MTMYKIDSHFHLWDLSNPWQTWPTEHEAEIYRDFCFDDFERVMQDESISQCILVQSAESLDETISLLEIAASEPRIAGVVGWIDFENPTRARSDYRRISQKNKLVGLRPMLQGKSDISWLVSPDVQSLVQEVAANGHTFDALVVPSQLPQLVDFAEQNPDLPIVLDHAGKPGDNDSLENWASLIVALGGCKNVYCKLSGLMTERPGPYNALEFRPVFNVLVRAFGYDRLIWGSDWPVVTMADRMSTWVQICEELLFGQPVDNWTAVFRDNACRFYGLGAPGSIIAQKGQPFQKVSS